MTTIDSREAEVTAIRLLHSGETVQAVADETGLTLEHVNRLRRDFPGGKNQGPQPAAVLGRRCDKTGCGRAATISDGAWDYCDAHAGRPVAPKPVQATPAATAVPAPSPSPIGLLLEQASGHSRARIRNLANRIEDHLDTLRALILEQQDQENARKKLEADRAKAKADIDRLKAELAAAQARLKTPTAGASKVKKPMSDEQRAAISAGLAKARAAKAAKAASA